MKLENYKKNYFKKEDIRHAQRVKTLSLKLFRELTEFFPEKLNRFSAQKNLLEIAAELHDIGSFAEHELEAPHNKIGAKLILSDGIDELDETQTLVVAALVKYHRGKNPHGEHKIFSKLNKAQKDMVLVFAAILKLADALDCEDFELEQGTEGFIIKPVTVPTKVFFNKKKKLFEEVFETKIELHGLSGALYSASERDK